MTVLLSLLTASGSEVEWTRALMISWLIIVFALSAIEIRLHPTKQTQQKF